MNRNQTHLRTSWFITEQKLHRFDPKGMNNIYQYITVVFELKMCYMKK